MTTRSSQGVQVVLFVAWLACSTSWAQDSSRVIDPVSPSGLRYYAQGGVVVDGIAYFTSDDGGCVPTDRTDAYSAVVAFDLQTFRKLRTYPLSKTYDSSPLVFTKEGWDLAGHRPRTQEAADGGDQPRHGPRRVD